MQNHNFKALNLKFRVLLFLFVPVFAAAQTEKPGHVERAVTHHLAKDDIAQQPEASPMLTRPVPAHIDEVESPAGLVAKQVGDDIYFYQNSTIERYSLPTLQWLAPVPLDTVATAFAADSQGIYVAHDRALYRYNLDSSRTFLGNSPTTVNELTVLGGWIIYQSSGIYISRNKLTGALIDEEPYFYDTQGIAALGSRLQLVGRSTGVSPSDIVMVVLDAGGNFLLQNDSPYHGDYPGSTRVYPFPTESRVVDGAGIVYHAADLTYGGSLAGFVDHVAFYGDLPIVLRGGELTSYSNVFLETGRYTPPTTPHTFFIHEEDLVAFDYQGNSINVQVIPIELLTPAEPGAPIDPTGISYDIDGIAYDGDRTVMVLNRQFANVFQYDIVLRRYVDSIPLIEAPLFMAYSETNDRLYFAYPSGMISQMDPSVGTETGFVNSPQMPCGLATAGEYVFVCDPSGAWVSHFTYSPAGSLISQEEWNYYSREYRWGELNRKMYHFRDDSSPNDLIWEDIGVDGTLGMQQDSPYHTGSYWQVPICVNPNGDNVVVGTGRVFDSLTLEQVNALSTDIDACAWSDGDFYTLLGQGGSSDLQHWSQVYELTTIRAFEGDPVSLIPLDAGALVIVTSAAGVPQFNVCGPPFLDCSAAPMFDSGFESD